MNADFVAVFEHARESDNHIGRLVRRELLMPPSKAHLKRLARDHDNFVDPPKIREVSQIDAAAKHADMMKRFSKMMADLGGTRTIRASPDYSQPAALTYIHPLEGEKLL